MIHLLASIVINAPKTFVENEPYLFSLEIDGENAFLPNIDAIDGFMVEKAGQSRSISNINGVISSKITQQYRLYPTKDIIIPSFTIELDGKKYTTDPITVTKQKIKKTQSNFFSFNLTSSKNSLYVGESATVTLQFKYRKDVNIVQLNLNPPSFENFWSKALDESKKYEENDFIVQELRYLIFPQKSGQLRIEPIAIDMVVLDSNSNGYSFFGSSTKNMKVYSNELLLDVQPLPQNVSLMGQFEIKTSLDKTVINEGENINYKVEISGKGNIDDVQDITLNLPNTTVYANKPEIKSVVKNNQYEGSYKKTFSLLPTNDITIPSIEIAYFDNKSKTIKTIKSKSYQVLVKKTLQHPSVKLEKLEKPKTKEMVPTRKVVQQSTFEERLIYFLMGIVVTLLSIGLYFYVINKKAKKDFKTLPLIKSVSQCKSSQDLIKILLPYIDSNETIKQFVFDLEKSEPSALRQLKKRAKNLIKEYDIKA